MKKVDYSAEAVMALIGDLISKYTNEKPSESVSETKEITLPL